MQICKNKMKSSVDCSKSKPFATLFGWFRTFITYVYIYYSYINEKRNTTSKEIYLESVIVSTISSYMHIWLKCIFLQH